MQATLPCRSIVKKNQNTTQKKQAPNPKLNSWCFNSRVLQQTEEKLTGSQVGKRTEKRRKRQISLLECSTEMTGLSPKPGLATQKVSQGGSSCAPGAHPTSCEQSLALPQPPRSPRRRPYSRKAPDPGFGWAKAGMAAGTTVWQ